MTTESRPVTKRLKEETAEHHKAAERHEFQQALVRGSVSREAYIDYLGQMLLLHAALESRLRAAARATPAITRVVKDYQHQEPYLRRDLAYFGVDPGSLTASPQTKAFITTLDRVAAERPLALLGYHYVLEGSNNGSKYIAKAIRRSFSLGGQDGTAYLDPYGEEQMPRWAAFKADLEASDLSDAEGDVLVAAAAEMFEAIGRISEDLARAVHA
jgi:heme oxygenase